MPSEELFKQPPIQSMEMDEVTRLAIAPASMPRLFELAIQRGPEGVEMLERLMAMEERMAARRAAQEFAEAMARFKSTCPPVPRRTENTQFKVTKNGGSSNRRYASIEDIEATIRGPAGECGMSHRWGESAFTGGILTLGCIVSHVGGHSITSTASMPLESKAGCSEQQKYGIVYAYCQRYSLINAYGLTSCEEDTDGNEEVEKVTPEQVLELEALIEQRPFGARGKFLAWLDVQTMEQIPASRFVELRDSLLKKVAAQ